MQICSTCRHFACRQRGSTTLSFMALEEMTMDSFVLVFMKELTSSFVTQTSSALVVRVNTSIRRQLLLARLGSSSGNSAHTAMSSPLCVTHMTCQNTDWRRASVLRISFRWISLCSAVDVLLLTRAQTCMACNVLCYGSILYTREGAFGDAYRGTTDAIAVILLMPSIGDQRD
jgi:hypothetical protein